MNPGDRISIRLISENSGKCPAINFPVKNLSKNNIIEGITSFDENFFEYVNNLFYRIISYKYRSLAEFTVSIFAFLFVINFFTKGKYISFFQNKLIKFLILIFIPILLIVFYNSLFRFLSIVLGYGTGPGGDM